MNTQVKISTEYTYFGKPIKELVYPNGDAEYVIEMEDKFGQPQYKRVPKSHLDLIDGNAEIVSDISLVLDVDTKYPTMLEQIARIEGVNMSYDDDEDFTEIDAETGEPISEHEVRIHEARERLNALREEQRLKPKDKLEDILVDARADRVNNLKKETSEDKQVSGREEPTV